MKRIIIAGITFLMMSPTSHAASNFDTIQTLIQGQFKALSTDLGAALSYKALAPAEPQGITGFDIGVELTATKLGNASQWVSAATGGDDFATLPMPKLHVHKGLPFNVDVGMMYTSVPSTNIKLTGFELRYAFLEGSMTLPAVALRLTSSKLSGIDELDLSTTGYELTVSKGFAIFTPYAGIGKIETDSTPQGVAATAGLLKETIKDSKAFIGLNVNFGISNIAIEGDKTGDSTTYSLKYGFRW